MDGERTDTSRGDASQRLAEQLDGAIGPDGWLSDAFLRDRLNVARSDRRKNADLFAPFISADAAKDDALFYPVLSRLLRDHPEVIRAYDDRMRGSEHGKSLAYRLGRLLVDRFEGDTPEERWTAMIDGSLPEGSAERAIQGICQSLASGGWAPVQGEHVGSLFTIAAQAKRPRRPRGGVGWARPGPVSAAAAASAPVPLGGERSGTDSATLPSVAPAADDGSWSERRDQLAALLDALDRPDPDAAAVIVSASEALRQACEIADRAAADEARAAAHRAEVVAALRAIEAPSPLLEAASAASLDALEAAAADLWDLGTASEALVRAKADREAIRAAVDAANASDDDDALDRLVRRRREAAEALRSAQAGLDRLLARLTLGLAPLAATATGPTRAPGPNALETPLPQAGASVAEEPPASPGTTRVAGLEVGPVAEPREGVEESPAGEAEGSRPTSSVAAAALAEVVPATPPGPNADVPAQDEPPPREPAHGTGRDPAPAESALLEDVAAAMDPDPRTTGPVGTTAVVAWDRARAALAALLGRGELALAWHLARLMELDGAVPAVPEPVLRALVIGPRISGPYDRGVAPMAEAVAAASAAMAADLDHAGGEGPGDCEASLTLFLAALLRPALLSRASNARAEIGTLSLSGDLSPFAPLAISLAGLGHDLALSVEDLAQFAGSHDRQRLPAATRAVADWRAREARAKGVHAPSNLVLREMLAGSGRVGAMVEAALQGDLATVGSERAWLEALLTETPAIHAYVLSVEAGMGRPARDRIHGTALDWLSRKLREGSALLLDWLDAATAERASLDDSTRRRIGPALDRLRSILAALPRPEGGDGPLIAASRWILGQSLDDLAELVGGRDPAVDKGCRVDASRALLRLPSGCQIHADDTDPAFADEVADHRARLGAALLDAATVAATEAEALSRHIASGAILPARSLLERLARDGGSADAATLRQELDEAEARARQDGEAAILGLRLDLEPLQSIDLGTSARIESQLALLARIEAAIRRSVRADAADGVVLPARDGVRVAGVPADYPELRSLLDAIRTSKEAIEARVIDDQRARLEALVRTLADGGRADLAREASDVVATLEGRDRVTVEDRIVMLGLGQSLPDVGAASDPFAQFYPAFVEAAPTRADLDGAIAAGAALGPLDFSRLGEEDRQRSKALLSDWRRLADCLRQGKPVGAPAVEFLGRLGFVAASVDGESDLQPRRLRRARLLAQPLVADRWFLPPAYGSQAGRGIASFPLFLAAADLPDEQIVPQLAQVGRDQPCILLMFGRLTRPRRAAFARSMRRAKQTVLLIDESQILHLIAGTDWLERLFACAMPFGYLQPYTTDAADIPPEMFFGRESEIERIESRRSDGSLVYGGRQLGKSALLHHVRKRFDRPDLGRRAYVRDIKDLGTPASPSRQIWADVAWTLSDAIGAVAPEPDRVVEAVRSWLDADGGRRILLLLDEADEFLASESRTGFPNLVRLKSLMEETNRRFKVVFAGLHNVRRLASAPNSPLVHLSDPICIGPLNTSAESSVQARRLVIEPMRAAGYDYADANLVHALLTRVNYYPSLIQVFCKTLLEALAAQPVPAGDGPRWRLDRAQLFEGASAHDINGRIRERFQWTLNLDPRYELIAKVMALHRLDDGAGGELSSAAIAREVAPYWPAGVERLGAADLPLFLDEMVDLGVLMRVEPGRDAFGLRGAQVAQMLGQRDALADEILRIAEKEPRVDYDAARFHRRAAAGAAALRSPLTDRQLEILFHLGRPGLRYVAAPEGLVGPDAAQALAQLAEGWVDPSGRRLRGQLFAGEQAALRSAIELRRTEPLALVMAASGALRVSWLNWLNEQEPVRAGRILPIVVGEPDRLLQLRRGAEGSVLRARPWGEAMLRSWLAEAGLSDLDRRDERRLILLRTGGIPSLIERLAPRLAALVAARGEGRAALAAMEVAVPASVGALGLSERQMPAFCTTAELLGESEPGVPTDLATLVELLGTQNDGAAELIDTFVRLGLLERVSDGSAEGSIALSPFGALVWRIADGR